MPAGRPPIPAALRREVLVEAGHRCSIPTCRQTPVELSHIVPWAEVHEHSFDNLIALCPTCHTRFDGGEIDRKSMDIYKRNLGLLSNRYGDVELRVLQIFAENRDAEMVELPGGLDILVWYLLRDGLLRDTGNTSEIKFAGVHSSRLYAITDKGRAFANEWYSGHELK